MVGADRREEARLSREKLPVTNAIRVLREHGVAWTDHPYDYEARGGTEVSAREIGRAHV